MTGPWSVPVRLGELGKLPLRITPEPDGATRARIAKVVGVEALNALAVEATLKPWLDGVELHARFTAVVTQTCGITLDPFDSTLAADFTLHALPPGSPNAPVVEASEIAIDPEADDPPDELDGDAIDVGAYVVEHLALEVDPFPRKPGAVFEQPGGAEVVSPFAALLALKKDGESH